MVVQWAGRDTLWWAALVVLLVMVVNEVAALSGPNVCMVQQKYNITKRVKYRAPMSVRTYEWCFAMPPRCSKWSTEMRDLTRLETEERTAEVAVCCPGYKMKDVSCVPICPSGKMGHGCTEDCPPDKWGPNCVNECPDCLNGFCVPSTGECDCEEGWQGESCEISMSTVQAAPALMEELLTTTKSTIKTLPTTKSTVPTSRITELPTPISTPRHTVTDISTTSTSTTIIKAETTKATFTSTDKTETSTNPLVKSTQPTKSTSFLYDNTTKTPFTIDVFEKITTEKVPKVILTNYNRTETPQEGTSNMLSIEHEISTTLNPISIKTSLVPLHSSLNTTTDTATTTTTTAPSTTSTAPSTTSTITIISTTPSTVATSSTTTLKFTTDIVEESTKIETTKRTETTTKNHFTTLKFKPKEIWIKPTQKGVPIYIETKAKNHEIHAKIKNTSHRNEATSENTTPKTIIVSIIPTSVSHATFKKIALTTASYTSHKLNSATKYNKTEQSFTKSMTSQVSTAIPFTIKLLSTVSVKNSSYKVHFPKSNATFKVASSTKKVFLNTTKSTSEKHNKTMATLNSSMATLRSTLPTSNTTMATSTTNSMLSTLNANEKLNFSTILTTKPPTNKNVHESSTEVTTASVVHKKVFVKDEAISTVDKNLHFNINESTKVKFNHTSTIKKVNDSDVPIKVDITKTKGNVKYPETNSTKKVNAKWNVSKATTNSPITTQEPIEDETFHILTEPEHITAVMNDKEKDHTSLDLISVISIAGGVMMAVITVAVVIVMIERCKRPRYEDVRKMNDIRMQVMIDNKDPPPYVRSIFHTPLPDPPPPDNCHYQPISTLDRNLKQFMRPVVVQAISPIMLENFRGILECHYDHLPNRNHRINHEFGTMPTRCSVASSMKYDENQLRQRPLSVADYTIEALKCEAKMGIIDNTTSEPLYAEIPCWRPPSEHAIEVMNLNGEAVTEL